MTPGAPSPSPAPPPRSPSPSRHHTEYTVIGNSALGRPASNSRSPYLTLLALLSAGAILFRVRLGCGGNLPDKNATLPAAGTGSDTLSATDGTLTLTATYTLTVTAK